jgi:hypothetical protein
MEESQQNSERDLVARYEMKYIIRHELLPEIREFIKPFCKPDPNTSGTPPEYAITTLQLDAPNYALHFAKEREVDRRFKLRVRTYGEIGSAPVYCEVKAKLEDTIVKSRTGIPFELWGRELVHGVRLPNCFENRQQELDFLQFKRICWQIGAVPKVLVRYIRESYVGVVDRYARVTLDRKLQYQVTDSWSDFGRSGIWRSMDSAEAQGFGLDYSGHVLEIKTLSHMPVWVMEMVERFQLQRSGNCKYSTAIWCEGILGRYPGPNEESADMLAYAGGL